MYTGKAIENYYWWPTVLSYQLGCCYLGKGLSRQGRLAVAEVLK
jgi:hypothetical protein